MEQTADKAMERPATYEELSQLIDSSDEWVVGALIRLYSFQTADEQVTQATCHLNDFGFNAIDAGILTDISKYYLNNGFLSEKQIAFVRRTIKKYINQLLNVGVSPLSISKVKIASSKQETVMSASLLKNKETNEPSGISVKFCFPRGDSRFSEILAKVKTLPDRRWIADEKYWRVGLSLEAGDKLKEWEFEFSEGLLKWYDGLKGMTASEVKSIDVIGLKGNPYPYQLQGISFIESRKGRALVADSMGLGKTLQALGYVQLHLEKRPVVIVCPASLKLNWERECHLWLSEPGIIQIISGKKNGYDLYGEILIINYDILASWQEAIIAYCKGKNAILIGDEIHYCKNSQTIRTKAVKKLAKIFKHTIFLSGTPIVNKPAEFFNSINMIRPDLFPSYWRFMEEFTNKVYNHWTKSGYSFEGAKNTDKLHKLLTETIMIRRKKEDVLKDLPPKIHSILPFEIDNKGEYNKAADDIIDWVLENEGMEKAQRASRAKVLVEFEKLKQLTVKGKMATCIEWITDFLESGEKLVVFATHTKTLDILQKEFGKISVRLDGSTNQKDRQEAVDRFQGKREINRTIIPIAGGGYTVEIEYEDIPYEEQPKIFLGNTRAAGIGITLTAASNVMHIELPWTPGEFEQASDRCHRIGQKGTVNIWVPVALGTIEEDLAGILSSKQKTLAAVLDGKQVDEGSVLTELINKIKKKS